MTVIFVKELLVVGVSWEEREQESKMTPRIPGVEGE